MYELFNANIQWIPLKVLYHLPSESLAWRDKYKNEDTTGVDAIVLLCRSMYCTYKHLCDTCTSLDNTQQHGVIYCGYSRWEASAYLRRKNTLGNSWIQQRKNIIGNSWIQQVKNCLIQQFKNCLIQQVAIYVIASLSLSPAVRVLILLLYLTLHSDDWSVFRTSPLLLLATCLLLVVYYQQNAEP